MFRAKFYACHDHPLPHYPQRGRASSRGTRRGPRRADRRNPGISPGRSDLWFDAGLIVASGSNGTGAIQRFFQLKRASSIARA